jgi:hypothetical protein
MKKTLFAFVVTLFCFKSFAQENQFVVYSVKGTVSVVENNVETKAKIGRMLTAASTVKVGPGSFATIICNENRMFTIKKNGNYSTSSFKDSCKGTNTGSLSANYLKYVWNEMTKSKGSPEKNRKNYMSNVGAVSRDVSNVWIDPKLDTVNYVSGTVPLSWKAFSDAEEFDFKLFNADNSETAILSKTVKKKHIDIKDLLNVIKVGKAYLWTAMVKDEDNSVRKYLKYWSKEDYAAYYKTLTPAEGISETEAEKNFRVGFLLEEGHFLAEAQAHYLKATQLDPGNYIYRSVFMAFKKDYEIK